MALKSFFDATSACFSFAPMTFLAGCVIMHYLGLEQVCAKSIPLVHWGKANSVVILQPGYSKSDEWAARDLTNALWRITSKEFELRTNQTNTPEKCFLIGCGPLARQQFPEIDFDVLAPEEIVLKQRNKIILLAGGGHHGTLYAVSRFLQEKCHVRWWAPWAIDMPKNPHLRIDSLDIRETPAFKSRDMDWRHCRSADWATQNYLNNILVKGAGDYHDARSVHTFYQFVPPEKYYKIHPEWFSLVNGERISMHGQLCCTVPN